MGGLRPCLFAYLWEWGPEFGKHSYIILEHPLIRTYDLSCDPSLVVSDILDPKTSCLGKVHDLNTSISSLPQYCSSSSFQIVFLQGRMIF